MLGLTYELNSNIKDSDVTPGSRLSLDWGISQYLSERFEIGLQGSLNRQVSDDSGDDVYWDPSYHDRRNLIAAAVGYWPWTGRLYVNAKYALDFGVLQGFKRNTFMLNLLFLTNLATGN